MKTFVLAFMPAAMTACASDGATVCSEDRFRVSWGTFTSCCEDLGADGHLYVYGMVDPAVERGGELVMRSYFDRSGLPCLTAEGTTDCGCGTGASVACEDDDIGCAYGQTGSAMAAFFGDGDGVVFVPRGARESTLCGVDWNGLPAGGTVRGGPASSEEYTGRQTSYGSVTGVVPDAYSKCLDGVPGVTLTLRAVCTGDGTTGTISWGSHSVTCDSPTRNAVAKTFFAELDTSIQVEHSAKGWQGWAAACEGVGACEFVIDSDAVVRGDFGG